MTEFRETILVKVEGTEQKALKFGPHPSGTWEYYEAFDVPEEELNVTHETIPLSPAMGGPVVDIFEINPLKLLERPVEFKIRHVIQGRQEIINVIVERQVKAPVTELLLVGAKTITLAFGPRISGTRYDAGFLPIDVPEKELKVVRQVLPLRAGLGVPVVDLIEIEPLALLEKPVEFKIVHDAFPHEEVLRVIVENKIAGQKEPLIAVKVIGVEELTVKFGPYQPGLPMVSGYDPKDVPKHELLVTKTTVQADPNDPPIGGHYIDLIHIKPLKQLIKAAEFEVVHLSMMHQTTYRVLVKNHIVVSEAKIPVTK